MNRYRSLNFLIPFNLIVIVTIIVMITMISGLHGRQEKIFETAINDIKQEVARLSRITEGLLLSDRQILEDDITQVATDPRVKIGVIINASGNIIYATDFSMRGKPASQVVPEFNETLFSKALSTRTAILNQSENDDLVIAIMSYAQPDEKHLIRSNKKGAVFLVYDLTQEKEKVFQEALIENVIEISLVLIAGILSAWLLNKYITRPISNLQLATQVIAAGEFGRRLQLFGPHEIQGVTAAFNTMSMQIEKNLESLATQHKNTQTIIDNVVDGIITINKAYEITSFNHAAENMFYYAMADVLGKKLKFLFTDTIESQFDPIIKSGEKIVDESLFGQIVEMEGLRKNGKTFPADVGINFIDSDTDIKYVVIIRDITERRKIEQLKNEFISTVSHELRTPLTALNGAIGIVVAGASGEIPDKAKNLLELAQRNSDRLLLLISDLLDMEKILAGKMQFDNKIHSIQELIGDSITVNQTFAKNFHVNLLTRGNIETVYIEVDNKRFEQVLSNFISNACKFSHAGGVVEIEVCQSENRVRVNVIDFGQGIPEEFKESIFQKFSQADASNQRQVGGTGLGLSISKALVEHMGGEIGFNSTLGLGSTFYVEFPIAEKAA